MLKISLPLRLQLSLIVVIGTAFLKYHSWLQLYIYGAIALVWVVILGVEIVKLGGLLGGELIFLCLVALPLGWEKASFLLVRSLICLIVMNSFLLTLPPHSFGIALKGLPIPLALKENLLLAGQYLEILLAEIQRMQRGAQLRGLSGTRGWLRYASAAMIGALYLRTLERAERVYAAMITRGYNGQLPMDCQTNPQELLTIILVIVIASYITVSSY
ncbi:energy-coupling factor transporter transmembrane component T [Cylindrospermopsis raciborskii]|uniref:energy-coupling factor transporter transmembrane component T family protein n=1 Tax=Cylindrospermopsis raciborskii TaxID=77022 RepID=UPI00077898BF|nr:energy-coupling factor transporter transmembrane component T [Cylindrospermopsis raciborskii]MCZ2201693.1 energy-coupling factor transporter transmembrane component T [Cylindrospermopsis raciborskii PAMP2012]MCZ2205007.1 energy-coupling factor transporter transmembrane component T [Cylindrospermopsis raciborskii PAMP2011]